MKHLDDGALRRLYDDPLAVSEPDRVHFAACAECSDRFDAVAADARRAAALLAAPAEAVDVDAALVRLRSRPETARVGLLPRRLPWRPLAAAGVAAVAAVALAVTGAAQQLITVMQPSNVTVVPVTTSELQAIPDLTQFGTITTAGSPGCCGEPATAQVAEQLAGFAAPATSAAGTPTYGTMGRSTITFTFSATKAQAWAAAHSVTLPAMPSGLDGSSLQITVGPAIVEAYGANVNLQQDHSLPSLVVAKMRAPVLQSTGPTVKEIEDYLVSIPGFPPDLAAQLKALGDPATTLPLPVPVDRATAEQAQVNGVTATIVGDDTGLGAGAIWVKDGYVYGVAGTQSQDAILQIARSLH